MVFKRLSFERNQRMWNYAIADWNDAYANMQHISNGETFPGLWAEQADSTRKTLAKVDRLEAGIAYGPGERNRFDLFRPENTPEGLMVFVHGGYWLRFDKSFFSHLAQGSLANGWAVAIPSYTLCPDIRISGITREIAGAIETAAGMIEGPICIAGHSAGGHLVTRMVCEDSALPKNVRERIRTVMSISGVHDLRPIMHIEQNEELRLDETEAVAESPALKRPLPHTRLVCWVGAGERAEFLRQNALLANIWLGLGATVSCVEEPDRHHFDVIAGLAEADSPITRCLLDER